jgi:RNA polymerase sigma factor (sigma-70 family)
MNTYSFRKDLLAVQEELLRFAYKLTADREEANDLLQETSLKALDNEDKFEPDTNFRGWMYTIMRNIFINNYRKTAWTTASSSKETFSISASKRLPANGRKTGMSL